MMLSLIYSKDIESSVKNGGYFMGKWLELASIICALKLNLNLSKLEDRLILQKIAYLTQKLNLDLGYDFRWYTYGPYSRSLAYDTNKILTIIESKCKESKPIDKRVLDKLDNIINIFRKIAKEENTKLSKVLEIAASITMLRYDVYPQIKDPVLEIVKRKGVSKDFVIKVYETLLKYELLK